MFNLTLALQCVNDLIDMDEVERALLLLDNLPAKYREDPPPQVVRLRTDILAALCTTHAYMNSGLDSQVKPESAADNLRYNIRGRLVEAEVKKYNEQKLIPHLVDVGPGEYWIPIGLAQLGYRFTYWDIGVDQDTAKAAHPHLSLYRQPKRFLNQPQIFVALEIIEHLPSPQDLVTECLRHCEGWPERIHLSTPHNCYDESPKEWRKPCGLPHLRAYTRNEFLQTAEKLFPNYVWQMYADRIQSLRGLRKDTAQGQDTPIIPIG